MDRAIVANKTHGVYEEDSKGMLTVDIVLMNQIQDVLNRGRYLIKELI